ncbi:hypothetical protein A8938_2443 [Algoriphagus zhangzhouensis]|uniref:Lipocalin-like domain-containing protein n=2 Tax=Algoriphagus zhangzhouensis TaxID=1073327 RepID=A0A1M7ZDL8_9BACT|nr:hypothetical protein A8938_2443 [Algoriphagus zhangzhouensis]SHO62977.1 hypothetical protein SAMN04488108_2440 [Algoriphagus zhangzhouensis]
MNLINIPALILFFFLQGSPIQMQELLGKWQLVHFDGIDRIRNSPQFRSANPTALADMQAKIKNRLENTIYKFVENDSLLFTDFQNQRMIQKKAKLELSPENILTINSGGEIRKAKIVEVTDSKLVLEPISDSPGSGKLTFEKIIE